MAGNVSAASGTLAITIDTTRPTPPQASFVGNGLATTDLSLTFSEAVTAGTGDFTVIRNPSWIDNGPQSSVTVNSVTGSGTTSLVVNLTTAGGTFNNGGVVLVRYDQTGNDVMDLAGNKVSSREFYVGGDGSNVIDLSGYNPVHDGQTWLQQLRGNPGADVLIGTSLRDAFTDIGGTDTIVGGAGDDSIALTETRATGTQFLDIVRIGVGESTVSAWDVIGNSGASPTTSGFDITSATALLHDQLDLPSNVIASNVTNGTDNGITNVGALLNHSISNGIVTFFDANTAGSAVTINTTNLADALSYLGSNITTAGSTVAFIVDSDNSGAIVDAVDSLFVFQDGGATDIAVQLSGLGGISSAILGTTAGANVVQLVTSVPTVVNVTSITSVPASIGVGAVVSIEVTFSEAVKVTGTPQLTLETGATDRAVNYVSGSDTATLHFTYTVQAGDSSLDLDYLSIAALSLNGGSITDAAGNDIANLTLPAPGATGSLGANRPIVVDAAAPGALSAPDLDAASDLGLNTTDNLTSDTTPTVTGTGAEASATVTLYDTDGTTVLGTNVADGAGAWSITSSVLAAGVHTLTVKQTDLAGNVSAASGTLAITIDTTRPTTGSAGFVGVAAVTTTLDISFSEAVTAGIGDVIMTKNPSWINNLNAGAAQDASVTVNSVTGSGTSTLQFNITSTSGNLGGGNVVLVQFNQNGNDVIDLAGNKVSSRDLYIGGGGNNTIDLSNYGSASLQLLRGNGGTDILIGSSAGDIIFDGADTDTITGGGGADQITLSDTANGVNTPARDIVNIGVGESTGNATDVITKSSTVGTGFDINSVTAGNHDQLSLMANVIQGDVTNANGTDAGALVTHSITSGIITFQSAGDAPVVINAGNLSDALTYLSSNITDAGATVAFRFDGDGNGVATDSAVDALYVFQNNGTIPLAGGYVVPDTVVKLDLLVNVQLATLGTAEGPNVVQLIDLSPPEPMGFALTTNGAALNFAENAFATASVALSLKQNGVGGDIAITSVTGNGTTALTFNTGTTLAATDWVLQKYLATGVVNGISDVNGNFLGADDSTYGGSALGSSSNNTIDLSNATNFAATGGYGLDGFGGNDTLIGSVFTDYISGGAGADTMTGGTGQDYYQFEQFDSPVGVVSLGGNSLLDNGDVFSFAVGVDRITDFSVGEGMNLNSLHQDVSGLPGVGWMGASNVTPATATLPANGLATNQGFFMVQGSYSGATSFTVASGGADTLVVYDGDPTAGVTQTGIVLSGVTLAQLSAFSGNNLISHV